LRGLKPGSYEVEDYVDGKDLGTVQADAGGVAKLKTEFKEHVLLEVRLQNVHKGARRNSQWIGRLRGPRVDNLGGPS
jgi:hypothetical protein